jgi:hypothetical protein
MTAIERLREAVNRANRFPENWAPSLLEGVVSNLNDLGQAKVLLDGFRAEDGTGFVTPWLDLLEYPLGLGGPLPSSWLGRRVLVHTVNHSYETLLLSVGSGPLVYKSSEPIPKPSRANGGLIIMRLAPKDSFLYASVLRNSQWVFEPLAPYFHLHAAGDTMTQGPDSGGNAQQLIAGKPTSDQIYVTTVSPYFKDSGQLPPPTL